MRQCQRMMKDGDGEPVRCGKQVIDTDSKYCFYCSKVMNGLIKEEGNTIPLLIKAIDNHL